MGLIEEVESILRSADHIFKNEGIIRLHPFCDIGDQIGEELFIEVVLFEGFNHDKDQIFAGNSVDFFNIGQIEFLISGSLNIFHNNAVQHGKGSAGEEE